MRQRWNHSEPNLSAARDRTPFSSRNTSKGALLEESHAVFAAISSGLSISEARIAIRDGVVLRKASYETRQRVLDLLTYRYFWPGGEWCVRSLAKAAGEGATSPSFVSLAYLYYALRDRLAFEFVTGPLWDKWRQRSTGIGQADVMQFLAEREATNPQVKKWRESTRRKAGQSVLAALLDFGLLQGIQRKQIQKPVIAPEAVFHLLCVLVAEGTTGRDLVEARDWRLFLWSEAEVGQALGELSQRRWVRFEKSGGSVMLELLRQPGEDA